MSLKKTMSLFSLFIAVLVVPTILSSCTCKIKDDQLAKLEELRRQERAINSEISELQNTKSRIDREVSARTSEYNDCDGRREIVKQRLSVWPNIWPDYTPNP